jgi:hypothetical protein
MMKTEVNKRSRLSVPVSSVHGDHDCSQRIDAVCTAHNQPAIVPVGGMADQERQHDGGNELNQSDETKVEGAVGKFIDLPPDRQG